MKLKQYLFLFCVLTVAFIFRFYGLNWDQGFHLHPDERAIIMFSLPLHLPSDISFFLSPTSPWNPHFFAYGSLPLYLLKSIGSFISIFYPQATSYDQINLIGRFISVIFDMGTIVLIFLLGKKIFSKTVGILGALFYSISVFPIQAAHFYAVDTPLTFFILFTLYTLILLYEKPTFKKSVLIGILFGLSLATKSSALILVTSIGATLVSDFALIFIKNPHHPRIWFPHVPLFLKRLFFDGIIIGTTTIVTFYILEPYAFLDFKEFWRQTLEQSQMTHNAFIFPYTLQYVGKIPYLYEIKNIFLWGQGPLLSTISFLGVIYLFFIIALKNKERKWAHELILIIFLLSYFAVVGKFAVGWMRYMLPLYPLLCLFGAVFAYKILIVLKNKFRYWKLVVLVFIGSILIWPLSFMHIYSEDNTRVLATDWINNNIPIGANIATEHWDDGLPLGTQNNYKVEILQIYDMQNPLIEAQIYQAIQKTDYIIISSNRLYTPLQRIAQNCENWKISQEKCPQNADTYYQKLFNGELGFKKIIEFANYPKIPILNIPIDDQKADESFTVYDHPKVTIFQKIP